MLFIERLFGPGAESAWMQIFLVIFSVCCHEYAHARVALWQGDSTAADEGHLTLNPLKQMGPLSLVMLAFIGIAWGAVPVNPSRMKHRYSDALVSFAGPATNLLLFLLMGAACFLVVWRHGSVVAVEFFKIGAVLNIVLFLFNLIPVPPLDGYSILKHFFPRMFDFRTEFGKGIMLTLIIGIFYSSEYFFRVGYWLFKGYAMVFFSILKLLGVTG